MDADRRYAMNTRGAFAYPDQHLKINNTDLDPALVARRIQERFNLPSLPAI